MPGSGKCCHRSPLADPQGGRTCWCGSPGPGSRTAPVLSGYPNSTRPIRSGPSFWASVACWPIPNTLRLHIASKHSRRQAPGGSVVTFVVEHHIRDGHEADAKRIFDEATHHARRQPFHWSRNDPQRVITVICWESPEAFERQRRPRPQEVVDEEMRHFDTMTAELYDVVDRVNL